MAIEMMRALVVERPGIAVVQDVPRPEAGPDDVLVRVAAAGICGSDVELLQGRRPPPYVRYPIIPGHGWAGVVDEVGPNVHGVAPGDCVVAEGFRSCGVCARCREGRTNLCLNDYAETGFTHAGAFAEYLTVPARLVHRLPSDTSAAAAALLEPAACVANGLLEVDLRPGLAVAVVGAGTLGQLAVSVLRLTSPARLTAIDVQPQHLEMARIHGATDVFDAGSGDPAAILGGEFDLVVEAAGARGAAESALRLARRGGTVVLEGIVGDDAAPMPSDLITLRALRVQGVFGASSAAWQWVVDLFSRGLLETAGLVTHTYPLDRFTDAFDTLQNRDKRALKVQLTPNLQPRRRHP